MLIRFGPLGLLVPLCVSAAPPTFHKEIEPILQLHCQGCHRPGEAGPMPLLSYQQARPWAKAIRAAVLSGKMPPWQADPHVGKFSNDPSLTAEEKSTLMAWIDGGAAEGSISDAPKPKEFVDGWSISKPDVVLEMPTAVSIPAKGTLDYQFISVPTNFTEDKWVEAIEVRPGDRSVVHHAIVMADSGGGFREQEYLAGYAPGMMPQLWKPGQARLIKAGSNLIFQMHYQTNGKPAHDRTKIGLVFAKRPTTEQVICMQITGHWLAIPPGDADYHIQASETLHEAAYVVGLRAHMHLRGKSFVIRAVYPGGETETLLSIPKYDFNWQPYYYLQTPKLLPKGTRIEAAAVFDNSANNPFNPDPHNTVFWGPQTWDEMMIGWVDLAIPAHSGVRSSQNNTTRQIRSGSDD